MTIISNILTLGLIAAPALAAPSPLVEPYHEIELDHAHHENHTLEARVANYGFLCDPKKFNNEKNLNYCYEEKTTKTVYGAMQTLTTLNVCDGDPGCTSTATYTYTTTQSFSFSIGISADADPGEGSAFKGGATAGASWDWSKSTATGSAQGFQLQNGDAASVVLWPYMHQSCGVFASTPLSCTGRGSCIIEPYSAGNKRQINDPNACGLTPMLLPNKQANGAVTLCYTAGPKKGEGCTAPPMAAGM